MPNRHQPPDATNRLLIKLRPSRSLKAVEANMNLRPLYDTPQAKAALQGLAAEPQWFLADMPAQAVNPWDLAHARIAAQLGVLPAEVLFVEPDLFHTVFPDTDQKPAQTFAVGQDCRADPQDGTHGKAVGPDVFGWHLGDDYTQLGQAREAVQFTDPRTRIAHLDTGYYRAHDTVPEYVRRDLEKNFVDGDTDPHSSEDPDNRRLILDNSGHGTGTISILAGGKVPADGDVYLGGAPAAEVLALRIADSVVLLRTSALARALDYALTQRCDVVTLSMGGLPSRAWREIVDQAYEAGLCICAAAGNHIGIVPPYTLVYPARYSRVIAVCGVMADNQPYAGLKGTTLEGSFGPATAMASALAAYTPNIAWARFGCKSIVRRNGEGTSAATPQVAAAAALWFEKYKNELPRDWRRVEALRHALFSSAKLKANKKHFGNGVLQAHAALSVRPLMGLPKSEPSSHSFAFLRLITGIGLDEIPPREEMFNLELSQRWLLNPDLQKIVPDPEGQAGLGIKDLRRFMEALIEDEGTSQALRRHAADRYPTVFGRRPKLKVPPEVIPTVLPVCENQPVVGRPPHRRIRVFAVDPSFSTRLDTAGSNEVILSIRWEALKKGPIGEYLCVEDVDAANKRYNPVDLDDPHLLARDGWPLAEGNPQFHQQMVYAVAMKTIEHFERALGRPVLWRAATHPETAGAANGFTPCLTIRPHALNQANAYYSPQEAALLFGYFEAGADHLGDQMPGSRIYTCLSHDIIAHETTHAILDGMHHRFTEATNPDVPAFHEAFADIVALLQHFTIPEVLQQEISRTRGQIEAESMLGSLAVQFGRAMGGRGALRNAIGHMEDGIWKRWSPDPAELEKRRTPHTRGAVLVAAVFDAFIAIYQTRIADLLRIYTGGTGELPNGAIHPDLVGRLVDEAAKSAGHVLTMCIRAIDYLPPVDVTFFEYLRALITADFDLVHDDRLNYRVAFAEAFRRRGIYPLNLDKPTSDTLRTLSVDTLRWQGIDQSKITGKALRNKIMAQYKAVIDDLKAYANACFYLTDREKLFNATCEQQRSLHARLEALFRALPAFAAELGLDPAHPFEVLELRRAMRISPDGRHIPQIVIALTQSKTITTEQTSDTPAYIFHGGATLVVDLSIPAVQYRIIKSIDSDTRRKRTIDFLDDVHADPLRALFFATDRPEPFAALHALAENE